VTIALDAVDRRRVWAHAAEYGAADIAAGADGAVYLATISRPSVNPTTFKLADVRRS
jgi:hypothetical protein